jgi:hypothetical protein
MTKAWRIGVLAGIILSIAAGRAPADDWGGVSVGTDAHGHVEASLHNQHLRARYGWFAAEGWITDFVCDGSPNMAGEMLDASAGRGTLVNASISHDAADCKTLDLKWKVSDKSKSTYEQSITIYPNQPVLRIDYLSWNVNTVDIGAPGGEKRSTTDDRTQYTIYGSKQWKRRFVSYPMIYMDRAFWDVGFNGIREMDDARGLDYHGYLIMGITSRANGWGYGRVVPTETIDVMKLLVNAGFELFPDFKREHQPFTCYLFAASGGPAAVLEMGKKLADGGCAEIKPVTAAPLASPEQGVFDGQVMVKLSATTPGSVVRFTTDGSEPTENSPIYSPIVVDQTSDIYAKAFRTGWQPSVTLKQRYVISHPANGHSWKTPWRYRLPVDVEAPDAPVKDAVAAVVLDFGKALKEAARAGEIAGKFSWPSLRVVEVDDTGKISDPQVVYQWDSRGQYYSTDDGTLFVMLKGDTPAGAVRRFDVYFDTADQQIPGLAQPTTMEADEDVLWKGKLSYKISTAGNTCYIGATDGGLTGLVNRAGHDALDSNRGLPAGLVMQKYQADLTNFGPLHARISCVSDDGQWAERWDFYPDRAEYSVTKGNGAGTRGMIDLLKSTTDVEASAAPPPSLAVTARAVEVKP